MGREKRFSIPAAIFDELHFPYVKGRVWTTDAFLRETAGQVACDNLCGIRKCALKKGVAICGDCVDLGECKTVGTIILNNPEALKNLKE